MKYPLACHKWHACQGLPTPAIEQNNLKHLQQRIDFVNENQFKDHLTFFIKHGNSTEKACSICSVFVTKSLNEMTAEQHLFKIL